MASDTTIFEVIDPLSGLIGPSLFPRSIKASADVPVPSNPKDLDSIHNFMKSLELRSPEKLMNEAKRIVDGGAELLKSNLACFGENVGITDAMPAKGKDKPQERRPGLGLARKRAPFSLRTNSSQPPVILERTIDIDGLEDPDEFFDAYERMEKAKKEIQKQLGGSVENLSLYKPSNNARRRRPGILGKSYHYKHRYSSGPVESNEMLMSSQEIVDEDIPSAPKDNSQEIVDEDIPSAHKDPNPDGELEEVELAGSMKKTENEFSDILEELLSCNDEDLEGLGALNLLQERLNIKPLDQENLGMSELLDVGRISFFTMSESFRKPGRSSPVIDSVLKNLNKKPTMEHKVVANSVNPVSLPTPPKSPFASLSLLKKKILQPNPLRDPFSPVDVELSECPNASVAEPKDKLLRQVDAQNDLDMSSEMESHVDVGITEPLVMDAQEVIENSDVPLKQLVDENASLQNAHADSRPIEEANNDIDRTMNVNENESNHSIFEEEARDDTSSRQQTDPEQQPEVHQAELPRRKGVAGEKRIRKAHPLRKSLADAGTSFETGVRRSKRIKMRPLEYWKGERFLYGRVDNSLKLIGLKYVSPGKSNEKLKVMPYILAESSAYKELLELAARH